MSERIYTDLFARHARVRGALIPLLEDIQDRFGYLSEESLTRIAEHLHMPTSKVYGVATFYNMFRLKPQGQYVIRVCRGTSCHVRGSQTLLDLLEVVLGIEAGETTPDGLFTLETVPCLGACGIAPVMVVNDRFHGHMGAKSVERLLTQYRKDARYAAPR